MRHQDVIRILSKTIRSIDNRFHTRPKDGRYGYHPLSLGRFVWQCELTYRLRSQLRSTRSSFVDVGCGIGMKMVVADNWFTTYGVEICPDLAAVAQSFCRPESVTLGDALHHHYSPYDIVYFYSPFTDGLKQKKLEETICRQIDTNALVVANLASLKPEDYIALGCRPIWAEHFAGIFVKTDEETAKKLIAVADAWRAENDVPEI